MYIHAHTSTHTITHTCNSKSAAGRDYKSLCCHAELLCGASTHIRDVINASLLFNTQLLLLLHTLAWQIHLERYRKKSEYIQLHFWCAGIPCEQQNLQFTEKLGGRTLFLAPSSDYVSHLSTQYVLSEIRIGKKSGGSSGERVAEETLWLSK